MNLRIGLPRFQRIGINCAMKKYAMFHGEWNEAKADFAWKKLEFACEQMGVELLESHRSDQDVLMTWHLLEKLADA